MATITPAALDSLPRPDDQGASVRPARQLGPQHLGLLAILTLSGLLEFVRLSQNGYANVYYSGAVRSMLRSWHAFFFVAADPNGLITVDKPPLGLWLQGFSAKLFGFSPLSLLIPEGVCAVLAVALMYRIVAPRFGSVAALVASLALAVFPSFVAVSRDNGVDPLLILLMLAACGAALKAADSGRLRSLVWCAVLAGLAFNTKSLAALLCIPGIVLGYAICAPGSWRRRIAQLAAAGVVFLLVAASWMAVVDLTPAAQRPFVGSTSANTELQLTFGYNGFGRVGGQQGGPGSTKRYLTAAQTRPLVRPGLDAPPSSIETAYFRSHHHGVAPALRPKAAVHGRRRRTTPVPFGGTRSPVRIFGIGLGGQAGWLVPLALFGMIGLALAVRGRGDRRTAGLFVLGGWFVVELVTLDFSKGIVHPYYSSALGPGVAAMVGAGAVALASLLRSERTRRATWGLALAVLGITGSVAAQLVLIHREGDPTWWPIPLVALCGGALVAMVLARTRAVWAVGLAVGALLVAPLVFSFSVWLAPVNGTFPVAGPYSYPGTGGVGASPTAERADRALIVFLRTHGVTYPYGLLTQSADQADPLILLGLRATAVGGYNTTDPAMTGAQLAALVAAGKARYFLIAGPYAARGGNLASDAARLVCPEVPAIVWSDGTSYGNGSYLVDCNGLSHWLYRPYVYARAFQRSHPKARHYVL